MQASRFSMKLQFEYSRASLLAGIARPIVWWNGQDGNVNVEEEVKDGSDDAGMSANPDLDAGYLSLHIVPYCRVVR